MQDLAGMQNAVDMTIRAHEQAVCIPENPHAAQLPPHTRPAGRARISLLSQVPPVTFTDVLQLACGASENNTVTDLRDAVLLHMLCAYAPEPQFYTSVTAMIPLPPWVQLLRSNIPSSN